MCFLYDVVIKNVEDKRMGFWFGFDMFSIMFTTVFIIVK